MTVVGDTGDSGTARIRVTIPFAHIEKSTDDQPVRVFGWASVAVDDSGNVVVDHQDDIIPPAELERAAYDLVKSAAPLNVNHEGPDEGQLIEAIVFTPDKRAAMGLPEGRTGLWVGYEIHNPTIKKRVRSGELGEFSIEGDAERVPAEAA